MVKTFALAMLTLSALAANAILNRVGVARYGMDPMVFAVLRVGAGAAMLWVLVAMRRAPAPRVLTGRRIAGAAALTGYMVPFSWAYLTLDAGIGALILFGVLQIVVFGWALVRGQDIPVMRWLGALIALGGLALLVWPSAALALPLTGVLAMAAAGVAWAIYTLLGRGETDALAATAGNFVLALPLVLLALPWGGAGEFGVAGVVSAVTAGAVTSGLGYALFYRVMPDLPATLAGVAQLSVPVLTVAAGTLLLGEPLHLRMLVAGALVLGGIGVALVPLRRRGATR